MRPATAKHVIETADAINWFHETPCPVCKKMCYIDGASIGYRIDNTIENRKSYGDSMIEHPDNWVVVNTPQCAATVARSWKDKPERRKALILSIKDKLRRRERVVPWMNGSEMRCIGSIRKIRLYPRPKT